MPGPHRAHLQIFQPEAHLGMLLCWILLEHGGVKPEFETSMKGSQELQAWCQSCIRSWCRCSSLLCIYNREGVYCEASDCLKQMQLNVRCLRACSSYAEAMTLTFSLLPTFLVGHWQV